MGENTRIEWADHTLNWWTGCEPVSPACAGCYAESWAKRAGRDFSERRLTGGAIRSLPIKWQTQAAAFLEDHGRKQRVFVNSLSDFFDNKVPQAWRIDFFTLIKTTPDVIYMILTKRIGNAKRMLPADWGDGYPNVWIGATVANQEDADRDIPKLLEVPAVVHFLSCEPLLGEIDLTTLHSKVPFRGEPGLVDHWRNALTGEHGHFIGYSKGVLSDRLPHIDWVIAGGESGGRARPSHPDWFRSLRDQCAQARIAFHFKQWGEWVELDSHEPTRTIYSDDPAYERQTERCDGFISFDGHFVRSVSEARADAVYRGMVRIGKKKAGRLLDGRTWDELPKAGA